MYDMVALGNRSQRVEVVEIGYREGYGIDTRCYSVMIVSERGGESFDYIVKTFHYDAESEDDKEYARLCAEELKEAIEYDWQIKEEER